MFYRKIEFLEKNFQKQRLVSSKNYLNNEQYVEIQNHFVIVLSVLF